MTTTITICEHAAWHVLQVLAFVKEYTEYKQAQLAGNSVHVDRVFLQRLMPQLLDHLHYRIVDVSTLQELCRWAEND